MIKFHVVVAAGLLIFCTLAQADVNIKNRQTLSVQVNHNINGPLTLTCPIDKSGKGIVVLQLEKKGGRDYHGTCRLLPNRESRILFNKPLIPPGQYNGRMTYVGPIPAITVKGSVQ